MVFSLSTSKTGDNDVDRPRRAPTVTTNAKTTKATLAIRTVRVRANACARAAPPNAANRYRVLSRNRDAAWRWLVLRGRANR